MNFDAVALRLREGDDYPYHYQIGFTEEFVAHENFLCERTKAGAIMLDAVGKPVLGCTCGLVLSGKTDPSLPCFTEGGSFWTNNSAALISENDARTRPRNRCIHSGYQSFALIPVRSGEEMIGLLQLNDRRPNCFDTDLIRFFEHLGHQFALAIKRLQVQEELKTLNQSLEQQVEQRTAEIRDRSEQLRQLASELASWGSMRRRGSAECYTRTAARHRAYGYQHAEKGLDSSYKPHPYRIAPDSNYRDVDVRRRRTSSANARSRRGSVCHKERSFRCSDHGHQDCYPSIARPIPEKPKQLKTSNPPCHKPQRTSANNECLHLSFFRIANKENTRQPKNTIDPK
jgi:hypothetical protein